MSISEELYTRVFTKLRAVHPEPHLKRIANWVWVIVGLDSRAVGASESDRATHS